MATKKQIAGVGALMALCLGAGYQVGKVQHRPADMICVSDDGIGNASVDWWGPDGTLWSTARIQQSERIGVLFGN